MGKNIHFLTWLSKKLCLANIGLYATIIAIMVFPSLLIKILGTPTVITSSISFFAVFFMVSLVRAAYESLVIYEAPVKSLSLQKMLFLCIVTASTMSLISYFIKPTLGYFSIPVSVIIAMVIVGKLKAALWPVTDRPGFFNELPAKLALSKTSMYGFYAILVGFSYIACNKYSINFYYAFAAAFCIAMVFEELFSMDKIYAQKIGSLMIISITIWSLICAFASTAIIWVLCSHFGMPPQTATITGVVLLKLIQPWGSRKFILGV